MEYEMSLTVTYNVVCLLQIITILCEINFSVIFNVGVKLFLVSEKSGLDLPRIIVSQGLGRVTVLTDIMFMYQSKHSQY